MDNNKILPVVLAGGKSKRFGKDKSQAQLGDKILIDHILSEIINDFKEVIIVANDPIKYMLSEKITIISDFKKNLGPLGGIFSAMKWVKDNQKKYEWIATFPSDTPFFKKNILENFYNRINEKESELFFIKSNDKRHNIFGLWCVDLVDQLEKDLEMVLEKLKNGPIQLELKQLTCHLKKKILSLISILKKI